MKRLIRERAWILNDMRIFTWARHNHLTELEQRGIGGGNFLMVNGSFSVLNFLSKTYSYLTEGRTRGSELDMFCKFAYKLEYPLFPSSKELSNEGQKSSHSKIWNTFRGPLSHMAWPKGPVVAFAFPQDLSYAEVQEALDVNTTPIFFETQDGFGIYVDLISRDVDVWVDWVCSQIDNGVFTEENIIKTIRWIESR